MFWKKLKLIKADNSAKQYALQELKEIHVDFQKAISLIQKNINKDSIPEEADFILNTTSKVISAIRKLLD